MRIGIIVDGQAEFRSLPKFISKVGSPYTILSPVYADIQPFAPAKQIARTVKGRLPVLKSPDRVLVLMDLENRDVCPAGWAKEVETALNYTCSEAGTPLLAVVVKVSCFENWLVSDVDAFDHMRRRFSITTGVARTIVPDGADRIDAQELLCKAVKGRRYDKVQDAIQIMGIADPIAMARNSRSLRRFLRLLGCPTYREQSRSPLP
jgi:hypothetical protein